MVLITLAPGNAQGKVVRFTDSKGVIHITTAGREPGERAAPPGVPAPPAARGPLAPSQGPQPAAGLTPAPGPPPPASPAPAAAAKEAPPGAPAPGPARPDLDAREQPGVPAKISPSPEESGAPPASVPYTPAGDPFVNPSLRLRPVSAEGPPLVPVARAAAVPAGAIRTFKDRHGVIHIANQAEGPGPQERPWAAAGAGMAHPQAAVAPPAIRPVAWQPDAAAGAAVREAAGEDPVSSRAAGVQRVRDRTGVWRIANDAPGGQPPPATILAASTAGPPAPPVVQPPLDYPRLQAARHVSAGPLPGQTAVRSRRDRQGVIHISNAPVQESDRALACLAQMEKTLGPIIAEATRRYQLPPALVLAVIQAESSFVPQAVSPKGAMGLMQLMPGTACLLGVQDPFDPRENILAGCRYLRDRLDRFQGSLPLAVAAYNAGDSRVVAAGYSIPAIKETRDFVRSVLELYFLIENTTGGF